MRKLVAGQASANGHKFAMVGVAIDQTPDQGLAFLREFGTFDEIIAGAHWINSGAVKYIWQDPQGEPKVPQVLIVEREIVDVSARVLAVPVERVVARYFGTSEIMEWVERGAPLPRRLAATNGR